MKKIAIFVKGQTEQIFISELIKQIFGERKIAVDEQQFSGKQGMRKITIIRTKNITQDTEYYFRIYDCHGGGDQSTVKSDIVEQFPILNREAFSLIVGVRDVYPLTDIQKLRTMIGKNMPTGNIPINIILAVNEIESWFIAEENHYQQLSKNLTISLVNYITNIDIQKDTTETIPHPAEILHTIYQKVNFAYHKKRSQVQRTVSVLDYENLYIAVKTRNNSFNELISCLDKIIEEPAHA